MWVCSACKSFLGRLDKPRCAQCRRTGKKLLDWREVSWNSGPGGIESVERLCAACYMQKKRRCAADRATQEAAAAAEPRDAECQTVVDVDVPGIHLFHQARPCRAPMLDGRTLPIHIPPARQPEVLTQLLAERLSKVAKSKNLGTPLEDLPRYAAATDACAGGIVSILMDAVALAKDEMMMNPQDDASTDEVMDVAEETTITPLSSPERMKRGAVISIAVDLMAHQVCAAHSETVEAMGHVLEQGKTTYSVQAGLSHLGITLSPSTLSRRVAKQSALGIAGITEVMKNLPDEMDCHWKLIVDDFLVNTGTSRSLPKGKTGVTWDRIGAATSVMQIWSSSCPRLQADVIGDHRKAIRHIGPLSIDSRAMARAMHAADMECGCRLPFKSDAVLTGERRIPYGGADVAAAEEGPLSLKSVFPLHMEAMALNSGSGVENLLQKLLREVAPLTRDSRAMIINGDWGTYASMRWLVRNQYQKYKPLIPFPGIFHVEMNLQRGCLDEFEPIFSDLWSSTWRRAGQFNTTMMKPDRRKRMVAFTFEAWKSARKEALSMFTSPREEVPLEFWLLAYLYDWFVPLSLRLYPTFLSGDFDAFRTELLGAHRVFAHMHKRNYEKLSGMLLTDLQYWETWRPDIFAYVRGNLAHLSEEPIELYHSSARRTQKTNDSCLRFLQRVNANAVTRWQKRTAKTDVTSKPRVHGRRSRGFAEFDKKDVEAASRQIIAQFAAVNHGREAPTIDRQNGVLTSASLRGMRFRLSLLPWCLQDFSTKGERKISSPLLVDSEGDLCVLRCPYAGASAATMCEACQASETHRLDSMR